MIRFGWNILYIFRWSSSAASYCRQATLSRHQRYCWTRTLHTIQVIWWHHYSGRKAPSQGFEAILFFRRVAMVWRAHKIGMQFYKQNGEHNIERILCEILDEGLVWKWKQVPILAKNSKSKIIEKIHCFSYWDSPLTTQIIQLFSPKQCSLYSVIHSKCFFQFQPL